MISWLSGESTRIKLLLQPGGHIYTPRPASRLDCRHVQRPPAVGSPVTGRPGKRLTALSKDRLHDIREEKRTRQSMRVKSPDRLVVICRRIDSLPTASHDDNRRRAPYPAAITNLDRYRDTLTWNQHMWSILMDLRGVVPTKNSIREEQYPMMGIPDTSPLGVHAAGVRG